MWRNVRNEFGTLNWIEGEFIYTFWITYLISIWMWFEIHFKSIVNTATRGHWMFYYAHLPFVSSPEMFLIGLPNVGRFFSPHTMWLEDLFLKDLVPGPARASTTWCQSLFVPVGNFFHRFTNSTQALHISPDRFSKMRKHFSNSDSYFLLSVKRDDEDLALQMQQPEMDR